MLIGLHEILTDLGTSSGEIKFLFEPLSIRIFASFPVFNFIRINGSPFIAFISVVVRGNRFENLLHILIRTRTVHARHFAGFLPEVQNRG